MLTRRDLLKGAAMTAAVAGLSHPRGARAAGPFQWNPATNPNPSSLEKLARFILNEGNPYQTKTVAPFDDITSKYATGNDWIRHLQMDDNGASWAFGKLVKGNIKDRTHRVERALRIPYFITYAKVSNPQLEFLLVGYTPMRGNATVTGSACTASSTEYFTPCATLNPGNDWEMLGSLIMRELNPHLTGASGKENLVAVPALTSGHTAWEQEIEPQEFLTTLEFRRRSLTAEKCLRIPYRIREAVGSQWQKSQVLIGYEGSGGF
ncbi:MAG: twin-arginine translocation signal domain-containing protein [Candidatus Rokuibacteriota bacterium]